MIKIPLNPILITLLIISITTSCTNYESENYLAEENKAIADLIPVMTEADFMLAHRKFGDKKPVLFVLDDLDNKLGFDSSANIPDDDRKLLAPLIKSKMAIRKISKKDIKQNYWFDVAFLSEKDYKTNHEDSIIENVNKNSIIGYLWISRVVLFNDYKTGYISFAFYCGEDCYWDSLYEIRKVNGNWVKSRSICGGIA